MKKLVGKTTEMAQPAHSYAVKLVRVGEPAPAVFCDGPENAVNYWHEVVRKQTWYDEAKEHLVALLLTTRKEVIAFSLVSIGSLNESIAHPREIFRAAIVAAAYGVIIMHNHPSGNPTPSACDHAIAARLNSVSEVIQIRIFDHIIVGAPGQFYSFEGGFVSTPPKRKRRRA